MSRSRHSSHSSSQWRRNVADASGSRSSPSQIRSRWNVWIRRVRRGSPERRELLSAEPAVDGPGSVRIGKLHQRSSPSEALGRGRTSQAAEPVAVRLDHAPSILFRHGEATNGLEIVLMAERDLAGVAVARPEDVGRVDVAQRPIRGESPPQRPEQPVVDPVVEQRAPPHEQRQALGAVAKVLPAKLDRGEDGFRERRLGWFARVRYIKPVRGFCPITPVSLSRRTCSRVWNGLPPALRQIRSIRSSWSCWRSAARADGRCGGSRTGGA